MNDIKEQLSELNKMSKKSVALYHKFALSIGISDSALGILYALLTAEKPCSQYDLCSEWFIPKQTINTEVNVLQKKGLISLSQTEGARNKKNIALTDKGKEFAEKTVGKLYNAEVAAFFELTPEEREIYVRLNQKYNKSLTEKIDNILPINLSHTDQNFADKGDNFQC